MRGRTIFFVLVACLSLFSATAVAGKHRVVRGSKHADHLRLGAAANRVFALGGDDTVLGGGGNDRLRGGRGDDVLQGGSGADRLRGGQDDDVLDGGAGDDYLFGRGDGGDPDQIVCGAGEDTVVLGRGDTIMVEASASNDGADLEEPGDDDGCEHVKSPGHGPSACSSHEGGCGEGEQTCAANRDTCEESAEEPCVASESGCDDPVVSEPEPDEPVEAPDPDEPAEP